MRLSFAGGLFVACTVVVLGVIGCGSEDAVFPEVPDAALEVSTPTEDAGAIFNGPVQCPAKSCADLGYECGPQGDGCGNVIQCGTCPQGSFCGGGGPSKCGIGVAPDGGLCTPHTCTDLGATCGPQGDGCGNVL